MTLDYSKFFDVMDDTPSSNMFKGDEALNVRFFKKVCEDNTVVLDTGKYLSYLVDFIEIVIPNDANIPNVICRCVTPSDKIRFSKKWKLYQTNESKNEDSRQIIGFPINEWAFVDKKRCEMLTNMGFDTVEQIANMSEGTGLAITSSLGINGLVLKEKAANFLNQRAVLSQITNEVKNSLKENDNTESSSQHTEFNKSNRGSRYSKPSTQ